jgi:MSHA biogenesis protein MshE
MGRSAHSRRIRGPTEKGDRPVRAATDTEVEDIVETAAKRRLGDIVVERKLVTPEQLEEALAEQRTTGRKLGEVLVDLGFITRVDLAGVISEQWDDLRVTSRGRVAAEAPARQSAASGSSIVEVALRERLEALTAAVAARDARIAQQDATITALLARVTQLEPQA